MTARISPPKIFIPDLPDFLRPGGAPFRYPSYAKDWGIEQDFLVYLEDSYPAIVSDIQDADFTYLPVFWTRYHLHHDFGRSGLYELERALRVVMASPGKKFTVCQYADGPLVDLGDSIVFLGSRKSAAGTDVPLLSSPVPKPRFRPRVNYLASFVGRFDTHPLRADLAAKLAHRADVVFSERSLSPRRYSKKMLSAAIALCPRGYGGSSFRFFEAIQLEIIPWLIGDLDVRPFKKSIDWDSCSLYSSTVEEFLHDLDNIQQRDLAVMKKNLARIRSELEFGTWPKLLIRELSEGLLSN